MIKVWLAVAITVFLGAAVVHPVLLGFPVIWLLMSVAAKLGSNRIDRRGLDRRHRLLALRDAARAQREAERHEFLDRVKAESSLPAHEVDLDVSNSTSVIRRWRESGALYVPLGTCECEAYPRPHQHAGTAAERSVAAQSRTTVKPCTEGGPCRAADREIIYDGLGNRAASRCNRCERERYWLPYITGK